MVVLGGEALSYERDHPAHYTSPSFGLGTPGLLLLLESGYSCQP